MNLKLIKSALAALLILVANLLVAPVSTRALDYVHPDGAIGVEPNPTGTPTPQTNVIRFAIVRDGLGFVAGGGTVPSNPCPASTPNPSGPSATIVGGIPKDLITPCTPTGPIVAGTTSPSLSSSSTKSTSTKSSSSKPSPSASTDRMTTLQAGDVGLLYLTQTGATATPTYSLKTCIAAGHDAKWSNCVQGAILRDPPLSANTMILGADMAIASGGLAAVAWTEVTTAGVPAVATITYYISFTYDYGANWSIPSKIGHYDSTGGYAVPNDIDIAVTRGSFGTRFAVLLFFDRDDGENHELDVSPPILTLTPFKSNSATSDWLDLVIYDKTGIVLEVATVIDSTSTPVTPKMARGAANMFDLVGSGSDAFFHAFYGQGNSHKAFTWNGSNGDPAPGDPLTHYTRTISTLDVNGETDPQGILGNFPAATRTSGGAAVRTVSGIFDVPNGNIAATKRGGFYAPYWIAGNQFTNLLGSPTFVADVVRNVDAYYLDGAGLTQGPFYNINDRIMNGANPMPRCVDELTWTRSQLNDPPPGSPVVGSKCYQFYDQVPYGDLEYSIAENPAALVGNTLYIPTLIQYRTWGGSPARFWDNDASQNSPNGQKIVVSRYDLPFTVGALQQTKPKLAK